MTFEKPHFTVVIPTRDRADTLRSTLATVTSQEYDALDIIVSDNASEDDTREVVAAFDDPRIRYVNTGRRLSMSRNWEFALSHARRGFVTFVGDDDGLLPGAIDDAAALIRAQRTSALVWKKAQYQWPSHSDPGVRNFLSIPLENKLFRCDARTVLHDCSRFWTPYFLLPSVYNSFVDLEAFHRVIARSGQFFHSVTPDVYSGFALAGEVGSYVLTTRPLSVNGASGRSNGANVDLFFTAKPERSETSRWLAEMDLPLHPRMPAVVVGSVVAVVAEALLQANDRLYEGKLAIDMADVFRRVMRDVQYQPSTKYDATVATLRDVGLRSGQSRLVEAAISRYPNQPRERQAMTSGLSSDEVVTLDASKFDVTDVESACRLTAALLGPYRPPVTVRPYRHSAKYVSRALRLIGSRTSSWCWD